MKPAISRPRPEVGPYAPKIKQIMIDPSKIGDVVGQKGKTINAIIDETGVKIDITDEGAVSVCGIDAENIEKAINLIKIIVTDFEEGQILEEKLSASKNLVHSLSLLLEKKAWFISQKFQKKELSMWKMY